MEEEQSKSLREHLAVLRWRKALILVVALPIAAIATIAALAMPALYRSTATILVQEQEVPPDLVRSTITSFADERIQVISQQVMTRAMLLKLIDKYGLYEKQRARLTDQELVDRMRNDIRLTTVDANMSDRNSGRRVNATIAFTISYDSPSPERAQKVVEDLVALYLKENAKARAESISQTTAFLAQEAERVARQIQEIEANLAAFKKRNADRLPDSSAVNAQIAERIQSDIARLDRDINSLQERRLYLEGQLAVARPTVPPTLSPAGESVLTPEDRLRVVEAQRASAIAMYHDSHPDIRRMEREIDALRKMIADAKRSVAVPKADNPAYIALASQLDSTKREISQLTATRDDLRGKQKVQEAKLQQIPEIEREYRDLTRDYDNAQARYKDIKAKQMQAEIAQELEKDRKAERFTLGEPANYPESPIRPNRPAIALIGLVASVGGGVGVAWLRELLDPSIKGPLQLARIAAVPVLTAIPYIETRRERSDRRRLEMVVAAFLAILAVLFLVGVHVFLKPLPDVWEGVLRRVGI